MGTTNDLYQTNIGFQLLDKECSKCFRKFTQTEIGDRNYELWFDTDNDVDLKPVDTLFGQNGYELTIWIRSIEHRNCITIPQPPNTTF